jgi:hypothetical protein
MINSIPTKIPMAFFKNRNKKANPNIHVKFQGTLNSQSSFEKEKVGELIAQYYRVTVMKMVWYWHKINV